MKIIEISFLEYGIQINGGIGEMPIYSITKCGCFELKLKKFYSCPFIYFRVWKIRLAFRVLLKGF